MNNAVAQARRGGGLVDSAGIREPAGRREIDGLDPVPLVLLPGTLCDGRLFAPMLDRLNLSDRRVLHLSLEDERDMATLAVRSLGMLPSRTALLGFSLGGVLAIEIARRAPARVAGLALVGATARSVPPERWRERRDAVKQARTAGLRDFIAEAMLPLYTGSATSDATRATILAMADSGGVVAFARQTELALSRSDARPDLSALAMPALVVGGDADRVNPPAVQRELASLLPNADLRLIPNAGHFTPLDAPDVLAQTVARWLARVDRRPTIFQQELTR